MHLRYLETVTTIPINYCENIDKIIKIFEKKHFDYYGYLHKGKTIIVESIELELVLKSKTISLKKKQNTKYTIQPKPSGNTSLYVKGRWEKVPFYKRNNSKKELRFFMTCKFYCFYVKFFKHIFFYYNNSSYTII